jgi:hypothetical protein
MRWEIAEHLITITGEGFYEPTYYDSWYTVRCLGCPGQQEDDANHVLWEADEVEPEYVEVDVQEVLDAVIRHLREGGTMVDEPLAAAATTMSALSATIDTGLDLLHARLGGGERLYAD